MTDGRYYRATNKPELQEIYNEIDKLEKSRIETITYQSEPPEEFAFLVLCAGALLVLSMLLKKLWLTGITAFE
jgi:Ca-activated chloride channel family protein